MRAQIPRCSLLRYLFFRKITIKNLDFVWMLCRDTFPEIFIEDSGREYGFPFSAPELYQPNLFSFKFIVLWNTNQYTTMQVFIPFLLIETQLVTDFNLPCTRLLNSYKRTVLKQALMDPNRE